MTNKIKFNPHARRKARRLLLQALYQWQLASNSLRELTEQFAQDENMAQADSIYFQEALQIIPAKQQQLDDYLTPFLDRPILELDPIELAILRIGAYELSERLEIPYRVVINEAVELTKTFGSIEGHKYINGVLDKLAHQLRTVEAQQ
jgi:transcription antitermination protein NusB